MGFDFQVITDSVFQPFMGLALSLWKEREGKAVASWFYSGLLRARMLRMRPSYLARFTALPLNRRR